VDLSQACAKIVSGDDIVGSAFFVASDTLITCAHNVANIAVGDSVLLSYLGEIVEARVKHKDPEVFPERFPPWPFPDLAVLQVDGEIGTAIPLCDGIPPPREVELHSFGFHPAGELGGESLVLKYGLLGYADEHRAEPRLMLRGVIPLGYSGAPVWIDGEDCVVGMITYTDQASLSGGATPSVELVKSTTVLEKYLRREQPALQLDETLRHAEIPVDSVSAPVPSPRRISEQVASMREVPHDALVSAVAESPLPLRLEPEIPDDASLQGVGDAAIAALLDKADGERRRGHFHVARSYVAQALADESFEHATRKMRGRALRAEATSKLDLEADWSDAEAIAKLARDLAGDSSDQRILESSIVALRDGPGQALGILQGESAKEIVMWAGYVLQLKRMADCIDALTSLAPDDQDIGNVQRLLSLAYAFQRDRDAALRHAQRALRLNPEDVRVQFVAGFVLTMSAFPPSLWPDELMSWPQPLHPDMVVTGESITKALQQAADIFDGILADSDVQGMEREHIEIWKLASYALDPKRHDSASSYAKALVERPMPNFRAIPWVQMMRLSVEVAPALRLTEERVERKTAIAEEVLVVATEALRTGNPSRAESILRENVQAFEGEYADARRRFFLIESLIDQDRFSDAREEAASLSMGRDEVMLMIAQAESGVSKDTATIKLELERSYARTHNPMFLVNRCDIASVEKDWQYIADRAEELLSKVDTVVAARLAIYGCYNAGRNQEARKLASEYAARHPGNVPPDLIRIEALARERLGDPAAIDLFNRLVEAEPIERNILLLGNILIMHGDFAAVDVLARRLSGLSQLSSEIALRFAAWLRLQNREMAIELWRTAIRQEVPDEYVLLAYTLAMQLGVENEAESIRAAMQRLGTAREHGVSLLPQAEAIEALRRSVERNAEIGQSYRRGEIPVHFLCSVTNANLVKTHAVIPKRNSERKPQDWTAVYVRHGGRRSLPETSLPSGRPLMDATSYLLAERYGVTDSIVSTFGGIYVPDNLAAILAAALADSMPMQLNRRDVLKRLGQRIKSQQFEQIPRSHGLVPAVYEFAIQSDAKVVDWLPKTEPVSGIPLTEQPEYATKFGLTIRSLVEALKTWGELSEVRYREALERLGNLALDPIGEAPLPGMSLALAYNVPESLEEAGLLDLVARVFRVSVEESWVQHLMAEIHEDENREQDVIWVREVIERLRRGLDQTRAIAVVSPTSMTDGPVDETPEGRSLLCLVTAPLAGDDFIICDDRFVTAQRVREDGRQVVALYDVLVHLDATGVLSHERFLEILMDMKRSGLFYVPVLPEEILSCVSDAVVSADGYLTENQEMSALRCYVAYALLDDDALFPRSNPDAPVQLGQLPFIADLQAAVRGAILDLLANDSAENLSRADWVRENLAPSGLVGFGMARVAPPELSLDMEPVLYLSSLLTDND